MVKGWQKVRLGDILNINTGDMNAEDSVIDGIYPFFTRSIETQKINHYAYDTEALFIAGEGNFNVKYYKGKFNVHQRTYILTAIEKEKIDLKFLQNAIQPKVNKLVAESVGSTVQSLRKPIIGNIKIFIPQKTEQKKIAKILTSIDNMIEVTSKIMAKQKRIKTGLMQDLLTYGIDEGGNIRSGWNKVKLGDVADIISGSTPKTNILKYWENGTITWITPNDLNKLTNKYIKTSERKITNDGLKSCSTTLIKNKALIMSSRAPIGYLAISKNFCTNQGCKSFIFNKEYSTDYFYYGISFIVDKLKRLGEGTTFSEISKSKLENFSMVIPTSQTEQQKIASILSKQDEVIEKEEAKLKKLKRLKIALMQDLLTAKVRVKCFS